MEEIRELKDKVKAVADRFVVTADTGEIVEKKKAYKVLVSEDYIAMYGLHEVTGANEKPVYLKTKPNYTMIASRLKFEDGKQKRKYFYTDSFGEFVAKPEPKLYE